MRIFKPCEFCLVRKGDPAVFYTRAFSSYGGHETFGKEAKDRPETVWKTAEGAAKVAARLNEFLIWAATSRWSIGLVNDDRFWVVQERRGEP